MQTPDNSQASLPLKRCAAPGCPEWFVAKGRKKYHTAKCRWGITPNLRQHISRLSRRDELIASDEAMLELLIDLTDGIPFQEDGDGPMWSELHRFNTTLHDKGPTPDICLPMKKTVSALRRRFMLQRPTTPDEAFQYIFCLKILVKIGAGTLAAVPQLRRYAWEVVQFHLRRKDYKNLSNAVIVYANNWRLQNLDFFGNHFYKSPLQILEECQGGRDLEYWNSLHSAMTWNLRFFGKHWDATKRQKTVERLVSLACDVIGTPKVRLETHKTLAAYYNSLGKYDFALKHCEEINKSLLKHSCSPHELLSLLRPEIHALLGPGTREDEDRGIRIVENELLPAYRKAPHFYYQPVLEDWKTRYGRSFDIPKARYGSAIVTSLPRS